MPFWYRHNLIMLTELQIQNNKSLIESLLRSTRRKGIENVIHYLEENGFFIVPSSLYRHHNWRGGLAEHSLGVYRIASIKSACLPQASIIIAGLLHDICKASKLYYDEDGNIHEHHTHIKGHGYRSVKLLELCGLELTDDERRAIRWHMGGHHAHGDEERADLDLARQSQLWSVIKSADRMDASGHFM